MRYNSGPMGADHHGFRHSVIVVFLSGMVITLGLSGCATISVRTNYLPPRGAPEPTTMEVLAGASTKGRPMADSPALRDRVAEAFRKRFPGVKLVESGGDMVVFFTIVDYVPGCLPNCKKFKTYRNWSCEVEEYRRDTLVFNLEGASYDPFYDPATACAARFAKATGR